MLKKFSSVVLLFTFISPVFALYEEPFTITKTLDHPYSWITFVEDAQNKHWLVKQVKEDDDLIQQFALVLDALGAIIAQSVGVFTNEIIVIPPYSDIPGHINPAFPITLHSVVPGTEIINSNTLNIGLHQKCWSKNSQRGLRHPLTKVEKGLHYNIIHSMTYHPQLPVITAVDTFLSNTDRSNVHIFYDSIFDNYWTIDFGDIYRFNCNLPEKAIIQLTCFIDIQDLQQKHFNALQIFKHTLEELISFWKPSDIVRVLDSLTKQAGFSVYPHLSSPELEKKIIRVKRNIYANYDATIKLINILEYVLNHSCAYSSYSEY